MIAAVVNVAVNLGAPSNVYDITSSCPTGNCTWPLYQSLTICSTCNDLASQLEGIPVEPPEPGSNYTYPVTNWTLPSGLYLTVEESQSKQGLFAMTMNVTNAPNAENPIKESASFPLLNSTLSLLDFLIIIGPANYSNDYSTSTFITTGPFASECLLQVCIQTYNASETNTVFQKNVLGDPLFIGTGGVWGCWNQLFT
jgi:hypothetical protein